MHPQASGTYRTTAPAPAEPALLDLSVIIVNYNVREFLEQALRSLDRARGDLAMEVFVVDNNSVDGSVELVRGAFPDVHLITNRENAGFGRANNQAIAQARGRYLLILNPDTIVQEDTLQTLVRFMDEHPDAGAVGCKILNPDGSFAPESRRAFPTPATAFYRITGLSRLFPHSPTFGRYNLTYLPIDEVAEVDALSGSCMLVRHAALWWSREAWEEQGEWVEIAPSSPTPHPPSPTHGAGLFDEDFFMYGEDLDWCYRIQQAGWKVCYTPETQIIHYKGESTKKGELRYVRLFYGAMLLFTEKHLESRYSRLMAWALRVSILLRAGLGVAARVLRRSAGPLLDAALVYAAVVGVGLGRSLLAGASLSPLFYATVAPGYALSTVAGIAAAGGYRWRGRRRLRPALVGTTLGLLVVAAASFFIKGIAFSRLVVLGSFPVALALLLGRRLVQRRPAGRTGHDRRAVLVGAPTEAGRLHQLLAGRPMPPFTLIGYLTPEAPDAPDPSSPVPYLGTRHQLRDVVRLRQIDDVVFAADGLPNHLIIDLIQQLRDLPVQFRILAEGREHLIGKATIDDLSVPGLVEAEAAVGTPRSPAARRAFEVAVALLGLLGYPSVALTARIAGPTSQAASIAARLRQLPAVLAGRLALVGYHPAVDPAPPAGSPLRPGVVSVAESLPPPRLETDVQRAYGFYSTHASASLDWTLVLRALRQPERRTA